MKLNPQTIAGRRALAVLLGCLVMIGPFCIDAMFPAFAQMEGELGVSSVAIQQTLSAYLFAFAAMSLVHGPLSDALGRRKVLLAGLLVFLLASVGCALSNALGPLLLFRALQGLSAGAGMIVGRAIIRDLFEAADAQRLMSMVTMVFAIAPALAPVVGGWILGWTNWTGIFWFLALLGGALWLLVFTLLGETHPPKARTPLQAGPLARGYAQIIRDASFVRLALVASFNFGSIFLFIASAPVVIRAFLGLGDQDFVWLFLPIILGMTCGSIICSRLAGRFSIDQQIRWAFCLTLTATLGNVLYTQWTPEISLPWAVCPLFVNAIGTSIAFPVLMLAMLDRHPDRKGAASSAQAFISQSNNGLVAGILSPLLATSPKSLAWGALGSALIALSLWIWERNSARGGQPRSLATARKN